MQPRTEGNQRCLKFELTTLPRARMQAYRDYLGNIVHHFNIPGRQPQLKITAETTVEITPLTPLPDTLPFASEGEAWAALDAANKGGEYWDYLTPSQFTPPTEALRALASELKVERRGDPLALLRELNTAIYETFDYAPQTTAVDSPIDDALRARQGVCQDFAHIMIALVRGLRIPCRYVSGYLFHETNGKDRSAADATHAWVEAHLPELGWVGFDPTNNLLAGERNIRTAVGRDYADVPPTKGIFKGQARSELSVGVQVAPAEAPPPEGELRSLTMWIAPPVEDDQQQQQQQQQ
jgi:transglutaminase-like putative cysteine protease